MLISELLIGKGGNSYRFSSLIVFRMINADLSLEQVAELQCGLSNLAHKSTFVGQKLFH